MKRKLILIITAIMIVVLSACGNNASDQEISNNGQMNHGDISHGEMNHSGSGEVPPGLKEAENPTFKVGSEAVLQTDHMPGMKGATATIVGAYDTVAYVVSYTPTTGGERVTNHKWVIHQEIKDAGDKPLQSGAQVTLQADHMPGMMGATAEIVSGDQMTVYMVDYTPTTGGEKVTNHQWVTETELTAK
ncbi:DUF1541 domain-containing protein [Paenibacillus antri]|uniref:DUF1541 domain-containing protein n=1 Tax=Paenibacillus antri TaxID=2582848 RepID=A0A5R9GA78_9BACL|nr:YdhK family protein [Paenibacillus antri]TLS49984.1 DUF1541 domain-containing protein [Paenibacillus antri]